MEREGRAESARQFDLTNTRAYKEADENLKLSYDTLHSNIEQADLDRLFTGDQNDLNRLAQKYEVDQTVLTEYARIAQSQRELDEGARRFDITNTREYEQADDRIKLEYFKIEKTMDDADKQRLFTGDQNELNRIAEQYGIDQQVLTEYARIAQSQRELDEGARRFDITTTKDYELADDSLKA